jgi:hypothetical protein
MSILSSTDLGGFRLRRLIASTFLSLGRFIVENTEDMSGMPFAYVAVPSAAKAP